MPRYVISEHQINHLAILMGLPILICEACGKPIEPNQEVHTGFKRRFKKWTTYWVFHVSCYDERQKLEKQRIEMITLKCPQCGVTFEKNHSRHIFCSHKCAQKYFFKNGRGYSKITEIPSIFK